MRLREAEKLSILNSVKAVFSTDTDVWLFGSRCDDESRGGDIDLYLETPDLDTPVKRRIALKLALAEELGDQKIDIIVHNRSRPLLPIHELAKSRGIKLNTT